MKKEQAITLVALMITIVILLILAGVTINTLLVEENLADRGITAGEDYEKAQLKETLELEIVNLQSQKMAEGKKFNREDLKDLANIGAIIDDFGVPAEGKYNDYFFEIDERYRVTIIGKQRVEKPKLQAQKVTEGEVFGEYVEIKITASIQEGKIVSIEATNGAVLKEDAENTDTEKTYVVSKNGTYYFKVTADNQRTNFVSVEVNNIRIEKPNIVIKSITEEAYTIEVTNQYETGLITEYRYYINGQMKKSGTTEKTANIGRTNNNDTIYAEAYIGDKKMTSNIITVAGKLTSSLGASENNRWESLPHGTKSEGQYFQYYYGTPKNMLTVQFKHGAGARKLSTGL